MSDPEAQATAESVRDRMFASDHAAHAHGMAVTAIGPGSATVTMAVQRNMLNGFGTCHGGFIGTLADTAFAYACNSWGPLAVASGYAIDLLKPAQEGDLLTATGSVVQQAGRTGVYDVSVHNQRGECIAVFRGRSHRLPHKEAA